MGNTKIESELTTEQFDAFCAQLLKLPGKKRTCVGISELAATYGIDVSTEGARTFKNGPFARHLAKLNRGRETREALVAAACAGVHPLDALEEAMVIELQDHLTEAQTVDVKFVIGQLVKLRAALTMREDTRRKAETEKRKNRETEKKLELANAQLAKAEREKTDWEEKQTKIRAAASSAKDAANKPAASPDEIRAKVVDELDRILGITK